MSFSVWFTDVVSVVDCCGCASFAAATSWFWFVVVSLILGNVVRCFVKRLCVFFAAVRDAGRDLDR